MAEFLKVDGGRYIVMRRVRNLLMRVAQAWYSAIARMMKNFSERRRNLNSKCTFRYIEQRFQRCPASYLQKSRYEIPPSIDFLSPFIC